MNRGRVGGLVFLVVSAFYAYHASTIPVLPIDEFEAMSARSLPYVLAGIGIFLGLLTVAYPGESEPPGDGQKVVPGGWLGVFLLSLAVLVYAFVIEWLGFLVATFLFLCAGFPALGERRWVVVLLTSAALVGSLWLLLTGVLDIYLAPGRIFRQGVG